MNQFLLWKLLLNVGCLASLTSCTTGQPPEKSFNPLYIIIISVAAGVIVLIAIIVAVVIGCRRSTRYLYPDGEYILTHLNPVFDLWANQNGPHGEYDEIPADKVEEKAPDQKMGFEGLEEGARSTCPNEYEGLPPPPPPLDEAKGKGQNGEGVYDEARSAC